MSRIRFVTAQSLFEAFPEASQDIDAKPTDQHPMVFVRHLTSQGELKDAVAFCAYLLPRREAVWWACGCARALVGDIPKSRAVCLLAAEAWVCDPSDERRQAALDLGKQGDSNDPLTWVALAAGWSGGALASFEQFTLPVPPFMTARAARIAVVLCAHYLKPEERSARLKACIAEAVKLAETGL
jgi:hypothetical protein